MSKKLFIGGLAWATTDDSLREAFAPYGNIVEARVICDRQTGRSRGFGFVTYDSEESASAAREALHNTELNGRTIRVDSADDTPQHHAPRSGGYERRNYNSGDGGSEQRSDRSDRSERPSRPEKRERTDRQDRGFGGDYPMQDNDGGRGGRENRRREKKRDRNRYDDDDDRW